MSKVSTSSLLGYMRAVEDIKFILSITSCNELCGKLSEWVRIREYEFDGMMDGWSEAAYE